MPVYSSGSRRPGRPSRAFRLAYFDARPRTNYASALYRDPGATLDDLREAVATLEDLERAARRVMGGAHPLTSTIERHVGLAQIALRDRETPSAAEPPSPEDELDELDDV